MKKLTSFVVEDNIDVLEMLVNDISENFEDIEVIGKATSVVSAVKLLQKLNPDVLFLDIMLGDGTSFDILEIVPNLKAKVIFITASEDFAIKAFKFSAVDYILKPYSISDLKSSVAKARTYINPQTEQLDILNELVTNPDRVPTKISLHTSYKIIVVTIKDIIRCMSDNNYTTFYMNNNTKILVSKTLKHYSELLENLGFIRVHQSHLINKTYIKEYIKSDGGYLVLTDKTTVPVSKRKQHTVIEILRHI